MESSKSNISSDSLFNEKFIQEGIQTKSQEPTFSTCLEAIDPESVSKQKRKSDDNVDKRTSNVMKMWKIVQCRPAVKVYQSFEIILKLICLQHKKSLIGDRWCGNFQKSPHKKFLRAAFCFFGSISQVDCLVYFFCENIFFHITFFKKKKCLLDSSFFFENDKFKNKNSSTFYASSSAIYLGLS